MNDFKFNKNKKEKIDDDNAFFLADIKAKKLLNELFAILQKHDFFEAEKLKHPDTNRKIILESPDLSILDSHALKEWKNKDLTGLDLLYFAKYLHAAFYSEYLTYCADIDSTIKDAVRQNIKGIEKTEREKKARLAGIAKNSPYRKIEQEIIANFKSGKFGSDKKKCAKEESNRLKKEKNIDISERSIVERYLKKL